VAALFGTDAFWLLQMKFSTAAPSWDPLVWG